MLVKKLKYQLSNLSKIRQLVVQKITAVNSGVNLNHEQPEEQHRSYIFHETFKTTTTV